MIQWAALSWAHLIFRGATRIFESVFAEQFSLGFSAEKGMQDKMAAGRGQRGLCGNNCVGVFLRRSCSLAGAAIEVLGSFEKSASKQGLLSG